MEFTSDIGDNKGKNHPVEETFGSKPKAANIIRH